MTAERHAFTVAAPVRLVWALAFTAITAGAVWLVETHATQPAAQPPLAPHPAQPSTAALGVRILASYPVLSWSVLADGRALAATTSDDRHWQATVPAGTLELAVEAPPADALAGGPAAVRVTLQRAGREIHHDRWGDGATGLRLALDAPGISP